MTNDTETEATVGEGERCAGAKKDGSPCGRIAVRETSLGLRCSHHDPDPPVTPRQARQRALRLPVAEVRTPKDAMILASFAAVKVLQGKLSPRAAQVARGMLAEFRQAFRDSGIL